MNLPEALVKSVSTERHNKPGCLSATTLLSGTKQIILTDRHWDEIEEDVADLYYAISGTAVHSVLEKEEGAHDFNEEILSYGMDGVTITGKMDNYDMKEEVIKDYKNVSFWKIKFGDFEDWRKQGLEYAWLALKNGLKVKTCQFIAFIKDHSKREAKRDSSYPQAPVFVYSFPVTDEGLAEIETFIKEKIAEYKNSREMADDDIPPCTPEQRWDKATKYAVKKTSRKTAIRVLDNEDEANKMVADLGAEHFVEKRPGESVRCMDYCSCAKFCNYYRNNVAAVETQEDVSW
jgi:hypothetical protein